MASRAPKRTPDKSSADVVPIRTGQQYIDSLRGRNLTIYLFGEDICYGGLDGVTAGLQGRFGSDRVFDTPLSESGIAGLAVGAAMMGTRPVVEMQFTGLITVALDQIANSGAKARYVHDGGMSAPMVVRTVTYPSGNVYIGQSLEAWVAAC